MAKEVAGLIKLQIPGGKANPSPPVGPALGAKGVNIMEFCKQFNARTQDQAGKLIPAIITVYSDKSFEFVIKTPPVAVQLKEAEPENTALLFQQIAEQKHRWQLGNCRDGHRISHLTAATTFCHCNLIIEAVNQAM